MSSQNFPPDTTVAEALGLSSCAASIFTGHRTACVGCYLARFCTLRDVAAAYNLSLDTLLEELNAAALVEQNPLIGAHNDK